MYATEQQAAILRSAVAEIKKHPETFDMNEWAAFSNDCGTVCCLAGQIVRNAVTAKEWKVLASYGPGGPIPSIWSKADALLGLGSDAKTGTSTLFLIERWPIRFRPPLVCSCGEDDLKSSDCSCWYPNPTPEQLEARVEWWIKHGE